MLHTVNKSPTSSSALESALRIARPGDPILLIEDGVHAARRGAISEALIARALTAHPVYALEPDIRARGIAGIVDGIRRIGYVGFVDLVEQHAVVSWS